jgi:hypothetical protein
MSGDVITREQAYAAARAVLDRARVELAADYAAGRLTGPRLVAYERLLAEYAPERLLDRRATGEAPPALAA